MNTTNDLRYGVKYIDFWEKGGQLKGLLSASPEAAGDGVLSLDELTGWEWNWTGNDQVEAFTLTSADATAVALVPPGGFSLTGENTTFAADGSDADGLDQGVYESIAGDRTIDLGAALILDTISDGVAAGDALAGSITISPILDFDVVYSGFWADGESVTGQFSITEADAADGIASLDELLAWSWDWSGNAEVAAFSLTSKDSVVFELLPPGGFLLTGENTPFDDSFNDIDGLDQGFYEATSGSQAIDLGAVVIEDFVTGTAAIGNPALGSISVSSQGSSNSGGSGSTEPLVLIGSSAAETLFGGAGDDQLYGNGGGDRLIGNDGDDQLYGEPGADTLIDGEGDDVLYGNGGEDRLIGDGGNDVLYGGAEKDILLGGFGDDVLYGNGGGDQLVGDAGNDVIYGEASQETILGGTGEDVIYGNGGGDFIDPGTGLDWVWVGSDGAATVLLNEGEGYVTVVGFKSGMTQLSLGSSGLRADDLSFTRENNHARIFSGADLLAVVEWTSAETASRAII